MAKITDPDLLLQNRDVIFDFNNLRIQLIPGTGGTGASNSVLDDGGVTLQSLYSFAKEEWRTDSNLIKFPFPFVAITGEQFELINGWDFSDQTTKNLIRDAGWSLKNLTGASVEEYMNITSLGLFNNSAVDRAYYLQSATQSPVDIVLPGEVNQAIKIYGASGYGAIDYRTFFKIYLREQGKIYGFYDLIAEQNISQLTFRKYALPLVNSIDLKITATDSQIDSDSNGVADVSPYSGMSITYYAATQSRTIGGTPYPFHIIINGNSATAEKIYEFIQWSLRQSNDIDAGTSSVVRGDTAEELLQFIGDTLRTKRVDGQFGVYIDNFQAADTNRLEFTDSNGVIRTFPFVAAGNLLFNDNLQNDADAKYFVFFTNDDAGENLGRDFGTTYSILINDNSGNPITGTVGGTPSIPFDYDYDNNIQRGTQSAGFNAPFTAVALGLSTAQYVVTTGTITRSTANVINFVAALERNYLT
jgi:hypothetical protein